MISLRFFKFLLAGGFGSACYIIGSTLLTFAGLDPWVSSASVYTCLIPVVYSIQKNFVFKSDASHGRSFPRYLAIQFIGTCFSAGVPFVLEKFGIDPVISFVSVVVLVGLVNYPLQMNWAFGKNKSSVRQ